MGQDNGTCFTAMFKECIHVFIFSRIEELGVGKQFDALQPELVNPVQFFFDVFPGFTKVHRSEADEDMRIIRHPVRNILVGHMASRIEVRPDGFQKLRKGGRSGMVGIGVGTFQLFHDLRSIQIFRVRVRGQNHRMPQTCLSQVRQKFQIRHFGVNMKFHPLRMVRFRPGSSQACWIVIGSRQFVGGKGGLPLTTT